MCRSLSTLTTCDPCAEGSLGKLLDFCSLHRGTGAARRRHVAGGELSHDVYWYFPCLKMTWKICSLKGICSKETKTPPGGTGQVLSSSFARRCSQILSPFLFHSLNGCQRKSLIECLPESWCNLALTSLTQQQSLCHSEVGGVHLCTMNHCCSFFFKRVKSMTDKN